MKDQLLEINKFGARLITLMICKLDKRENLKDFNDN